MAVTTSDIYVHVTG